MKVTIHRGASQIGGCITEIATAESRILIDLGQNLPDNEGKINDSLANYSSISDLTKGIDAIFYTHYHGDHFGLFPYVPDEIPQYLDAVAKQVVICKYKTLRYISERKEQSEKEVAQLEKLKILEPANPVTNIQGFTVTPYFVSHSAYRSYMFLIEADEKRILHTGDFRDHGYLGKGLSKIIPHILKSGKIDILITEGTMLSRLDEKVKHEKDIKAEMIALMKEHKNVFVMCSSTDLERLATVYAANNTIRPVRPFICDAFQKDILNIFSETAGKESPLFKFKQSNGKDSVYDFKKTNDKLIHWMKDKGCCMLVWATDKFSDWLRFIDIQINKEESVLIFSMWGEYINPQSRHKKEQYLNFIKYFLTVKKIHTSGHASADCLAEVCNLVNPTTTIIPIHSECPEDFKKLAISDELKHKIRMDKIIEI
jgi:ribonuclease J